MSCPIARALTRSFDKTRNPLYEDLFDSWTDLLEEIERDEPTDADLKLRAFYIVEYTYGYAIPLALTHSGTHADVANQYARLDAPRSYEGLTTLIESCEKYERQLVINMGVSQLLGKVQKARTSQLAAMSGMLLPALDRAIALFLICGHAARQLRSSLSSELTGPAKLGGLYFGVLEALDRAGMDTVMDHARSLLHINISNPVSPIRGDDGVRT